MYFNFVIDFFERGNYEFFTIIIDHVIKVYIIALGIHSLLYNIFYMTKISQKGKLYFRPPPLFRVRTAMMVKNLY